MATRTGEGWGHRKNTGCGKKAETLALPLSSYVTFSKPFHFPESQRPLMQGTGVNYLFCFFWDRKQAFFWETHSSSGLEGLHLSHPHDRLDQSERSIAVHSDWLRIEHVT